MATPTTAKSLAKLRKAGYTCAIVEHFNPHAGVRQDLYNLIDILCLGDNEIIGIQTTSVNCFADHVKKIITHKNLMPIKKSGMRLILHGWEKKQVGKRLLWECKEKEF